MDVWMDRQEKVGSSNGKTVPVPLGQKRMDGQFQFQERRDGWMFRLLCELSRSPGIGLLTILGTTCPRCEANVVVAGYQCHIYDAWFLFQCPRCELAVEFAQRPGVAQRP